MGLLLGTAGGIITQAVKNVAQTYSAQPGVLATLGGGTLFSHLFHASPILVLLQEIVILLAVVQAIWPHLRANLLKGALSFQRHGVPQFWRTARRDRRPVL